MKHSVLFALFLLLGGIGHSQTTIDLLSEDSESIILRFAVKGYQSIPVSTPEGEAWIIQVEEGTPILKEGAPDLPKLTASVAIGDLTHTKVQVVSSKYKDITSVAVAPSKGNLLRNVDPASVPYSFGPAYQYDAFFPSEVAQLRHPYIFRDFRAQTVIFHPFQYNPVQQVLRVYEEVIVKIEKTEGNALNPFHRKKPAIAVNETYQQLYEKRFLNFEAQADRYNQIPELGNMLIISYGPYMDQLGEFVEWKRQKGIPTEVVDIAEIGTTPAMMNDYLTEYYHQNGLTYLLLVGDETTVPTAQTANNNACDHCYAYREGDDHYAEFFVGRFNAENEDQLQTMIDRTLEYEKNPDMENPDWFGTAIGSGSAEGPGDDGEYDYEHLNNIKMEMLAYTYGTVYEFYDGNQSADSPTPNTPAADAPGNPQNTAIAQIINEGSSFYNYTGHGSNTGLASGNFNVNTVHSLTNTGMYPFLVAVACCVGDFQNDFGSGECLGDAWIRAKNDVTGEPAGGIGGLFSSILQSWSPPMEGQDEINKLICETGTYPTRHTVGGLSIHGFGAMIDAYGGGGEEMADTWNIFGDPSVVLWTDTPLEMAVTHDAAVNVGATQLDVFCDVEDALVGLYYQGEILGTGLVSGGLASIQFEPVDVPENILVTVTAFNHLPYQGPVEVVVTQGAYVLMAEFTLEDPAGNNNHLADYSEPISLNLTLENVGQATAFNVNATLSTFSTDVIITDDQAGFGDIQEATQVDMDNAFSFTVKDHIVDQKIVWFTITLSDDENEWTHDLPVTLYAPVMEAPVDFVVDDDQTGNGNARLEGGETVQLLLPTTNTGHSLAPTATGHLEVNSPYVTVLNPIVALGAIEQGEGTDAVFSLVIADDVPMMTPIELVYTIEAGPYGDAKTYQRVINLIVEDFENGYSDDFEWDSLGAIDWFTTGLQPYHGASCSQSGAVEDDELTQMSLDILVLEAGPLTFARRVSSENGWDFLRFYIDGVLQDEWSGELPWTEVTYSLDAGPHTLLWSYEKDVFVSAGEDAAWVDDIIFPLVELPEEPNPNSTMDQDLSIFDLQVSPNPVQATATVQFNLSERQQVSMILFNAHGQALLFIDKQELPAGTHLESFSMGNFPAGVYWLRVNTTTGARTVKIVH